MSEHITLYELASAGDERFSPYCWRTRFALGHKSLPFETIGVGFTEIVAGIGGGHKAVPVLDIGGHEISDSWKIAEYLDEKYPENPLFGIDNRDRNFCHFLDIWANQTLVPLIAPMVVMEIFHKINEKDRAYFRMSREKRFGKLEDTEQNLDDKIKSFRRALEPVRTLLQESEWLGGTSPHYADYIVAGTLLWPRIISSKTLLAKDDPVQIWLEKCVEHLESVPA